MKRTVKITLIVVGVIVLFLVLGLLIFSGFLPYHLLAFSNSCAEECSETGYASSQCILFPSIWKADESPCGNSGVSVGMTSDCRNKARFGGSNNCCCYN